jgi:hypothetical protein
MEDSVLKRKGDKMFQMDESFDKNSIIIVVCIVILFGFSAYMFREYKKVKLDIDEIKKAVQDSASNSNSEDLLKMREDVSNNTQTIGAVNAKLDQLIIIFQKTIGAQRSMERSTEIDQKSSERPDQKKHKQKLSPVSETLFDDQEELESDESEESEIEVVQPTKKAKKIIIS